VVIVSIAVARSEFGESVLVKSCRKALAVVMP
jgi:hypothetical protein